jgi:hypothetical protein
MDRFAESSSVRLWLPPHPKGVCRAFAERLIDTPTVAELRDLHVHGDGFAVTAPFVLHEQLFKDGYHELEPRLSLTGSD